MRRLRVNPISSSAVILSVALGIGLNAGVYSILDWVLWRSLPYPSPHQLVRVFTAAVAPATGPRALTADEFARFGRAGSFASAAAFVTATRVLASTGTPPVHVVVARVEGDLPATLGAPLAAGRSFRPEEIAAGAPVVILSRGL